KVITIDLNPLSRTAKASHITIVDNVIRAMPLLVRYVDSMKGSSRKNLQQVVDGFDNARNLDESLRIIRGAVQ
ncbi:MAG TPA: phosphopantothenate/pantothenate synthetase family protein, partial [Nitrososphaera sp.]|nr:phosphopantothenate/pantothenate synthetase family protein [Nitrososphaera sp.]